MVYFHFRFNFKWLKLMAQIFVLAGTGVFMGCIPNSQQTPSILVIAVESLSFDKIVCQKKEGFSQNSGFKTICDEAIRFTHAYAPSALSQSTLTSILTAKNPIEHGVWNNGSATLSPATLTLPEAAIKKEYSTFFISGGAPILKKSGIDQGFEWFDDRFFAKNNFLFRSAQENIQIFLRLIQRPIKKFLGFIYLNDLMYPQFDTYTNQGQLRSRSLSSQIEEVDESLNELFNELKRRKIWNSTTVIILGLNGHPKPKRDNLAQPMNLFSENTHVSLFIKPSQKPRDLPINWTINKNVTLTDVGLTLFDLIDESPQTPSNRLLELTSLKSVLSSPQVTWNEDRLILLESAWPSWRAYSNSHFALRKGHFLIINNSPIEIYNSLIDQNENIKLNQTEPLYKELVEEAEKYFNEKLITKNQPLKKEDFQIYSLSRKIWPFPTKISKRDYYLLKNKAFDEKKYPQMAQWFAQVTLLKKYWRTLDLLGQHWGITAWSHIASLNQGKISKLPKKGCFKIFHFNSQNFRRLSSKECSDETLIKTADWILEQNSTKKRRKYDIFLRAFKEENEFKQIAAYNQSLNQIMDVSLKQPLGPSLTNLYLALPKNKAYLKKVPMENYFNTKFDK